VARIIHNFGRADKLDRDVLVRLCKSIARICGVTVLDANDVPGEGIHSDDIKLIKTLGIGPVTVIEELWEKLGIGATLRRVINSKGCQIPYDQALLAMVANRLCSPESKLGVWDRWLSKVYLPNCWDLNLRHMYDAMDLLYQHSETIEKTVFNQTADLFNLEVDLIFYDTTTVSFSIDDEDEDENDYEEGLRKYGHSKSGVWAPQIVVALAVTREGIPVKCWVFKGNMSDVKTIEHIRKDLKKWKLGRALFVADSGMNSEENRIELARACGKYLLASRMATVSEVKRDVLSKRGPYRVIKDNLHAKEVIVGDGERRRRYILCFNPKEAERQRKHREMVVKKLEEELFSHRENTVTAQWAIELLASRRYKRYLTVTKNGQVRLNRGAVKEAGRYDGKWVIETNDDTIGFEDAASGYKSLLVIERCFRSLKKTQIKMEPVYHWSPRRIESHIKICVLSLLIQRIAELACDMPWSKIHNILERLQVTECQTSSHVFFKLNEIPQEVRDIFKKVEIHLPKGILGIDNLP
jgi:transposase